MAEITQTDPIAAKREAEELRVQAQSLLSRAEALDPTPVKKSSPRKSPSNKGKGKGGKNTKKATGKGKK